MFSLKTQGGLVCNQENMLAKHILQKLLLLVSKQNNKTAFLINLF
ncbi:MAG: hypothetical protein ACJAXN_001048 [Psychromonas sp.]